MKKVSDHRLDILIFNAYCLMTVDLELDPDPKTNLDVVLQRNMLSPKFRNASFVRLLWAKYPCLI